ncbi:MAG: hypothetical protein KAY32_08685 [Candidatus Eisenbacteria sp.]|nr:hypothetical protein [Candidatus Eisenbacteria bacterium]
MKHAPRRPDGIRFLENLAYLVPGYHGYKHRDLRRQEDSRLRARVCRSIQRLLDEVDRVRAHWQNRAAPAQVEDLEERRVRLARDTDAVRFAPGDLWSFFETEKVREITLERILESDLLIFEDLEDAETHLAQGSRLSGAPRTLERYLRDLDQILHRLEEHLIMRERVLAGG